MGIGEQAEESNNRGVVLKEAVTNTRVVEDRDIADQLRARLDRCVELEEALDEMTRLFDNQVKQNGELETELKALRALDERWNKLDQREAAIANREETLSAREQRQDMVDELHRVQLECAQSRIDDHKNMVGLVFRNPITTTSRAHHLMDPNGYAQAVTDTTTVTQE